MPLAMSTRVDAPYSGSSSYRSPGPGSHRGAGWALGVMPLVMLAVQYVLTYVLIERGPRQCLPPSRL
jgi:hypothetical protein